MSVVTVDQIKTQILTGTYPANTIISDNVFTKEQYVRRRRYPSCEIIVTSPQGNQQTKSETTTVFAFEVRYYTKNLGDQTDEISTQNSVETEILSKLDSLTLQDHRVVFQSKIWRREQYQRDGDTPAYLLSVLKVDVRRVNAPTITLDGALTFILSGSEVDSPPAGNYAFDAFDVDIQEGYTGVKESVSTSPNGFAVPIHYTGQFGGRFICSIIVKTADFGSTGEKLNKLMTLQSTGEKPEANFTWTNKTNITTPATITETIRLEIDSIQRLYRKDQNVIVRVFADIMTPSTITAS